MHHISLNLSPKQASKLRNGHKVRVKKGEGFNLIVRPETYHIVSKAFTRNKGAEIALSPEEIEFNKSPDINNELMEINPKGQGLFKHKKGCSVQSKFENAFDPYKNGIMTGKGMWDWAKPQNIAQAFQPVAQAFQPVAQTIAPAVPILKVIAKEVAKEAIPYAVDYGKDYLKAGVTTTMGPVAGTVINRQIDKYADKGTPILTDYVVDKIGSGLRGVRGGRGRGLSNGDFGIIARPIDDFNLEYLRSLDDRSGSHYSNLARSTLENAKANEMNEKFTRLGLNERREANNIMGNGIRVVAREGQYIPQALISQPFSANYQFRHTFPVNFQLMTKSSERDSMRGTGLYL
jgi:hypothetical protein